MSTISIAGSASSSSSVSKTRSSRRVSPPAVVVDPDDLAAVLRVRRQVRVPHDLAAADDADSRPVAGRGTRGGSRSREVEHDLHGLVAVARREGGTRRRRPRRRRRARSAARARADPACAARSPSAPGGRPTSAARVAAPRSRSATRRARCGCGGTPRRAGGRSRRPARSRRRRRAPRTQPSGSPRAGPPPEPVSSITTSAPRPSVRRLIVSATGSAASTTTAAPSFRASSSRRSIRSTATTVPPLRRASCAAISPGTPWPKTATVSPTCTSASSTAFSATAPMRGNTPQSGGESAGRTWSATRSSASTAALRWPQMPHTTSPGSTAVTAARHRLDGTDLLVAPRLERVRERRLAVDEEPRVGSPTASSRRDSCPGTPSARSGGDSGVERPDEHLTTPGARASYSTSATSRGARKSTIRSATGYSDVDSGGAPESVTSASPLGVHPADPLGRDPQPDVGLGAGKSSRRRGHLQHVLARPDGEQVVRAERLDDDDRGADRSPSLGCVSTWIDSARIPSTTSRPASGRASSPRGKRAAARPRDGAPPFGDHLGGDEVHRRRADEPADEHVGRAGRRPQRAVDLHDPAGVHDRDPVAHAERLDLVVRDVDRRRVELLQERLQLGAHLHPQERVEVRERLVHQQHVAFVAIARATATRWRWPPESCAG